MNIINTNHKKTKQFLLVLNYYKKEFNIKFPKALTFSILERFAGSGISFLFYFINKGIRYNPTIIAREIAKYKIPYVSIYAHKALEESEKNGGFIFIGRIFITF